MDKELKEYLKAHPAKGFRARPYYSVAGDCVIFYASNERCHAKRINELLTVYVSVESDKAIGCKIKGVRRLILSRFGKLVRSPQGADLKSLILGGMALSREVEEHPESGSFDEIADLIEGILVEEGELQQA
jgi:hypothetical protein